MADGVRLADKPIIGNPDHLVGLDNLGNVRRVDMDVVTEIVRAAVGGPNYQTLAQLNADLAHAAGTLGVVWDDPTPSNDGVYKKSGASGAGSWAKIGPLPATDTSAIEADIAALETGKQDLDATLTDLAARDIGAASGTSILDRAAGDTRYINSGELNSISNGMLADMAEGMVKMRRVGEGTGNPVDATMNQLRTDLSINNVNNTSDINKPVSTAQAAALALKQQAAPLLDAVAGVSATPGLWEQIGEANIIKRAIGVGTAQSIPTRADADARFSPISQAATVTTLQTFSESLVRATPDRPGDSPALFMPLRDGDSVAAAQFPATWLVDAGTVFGKVLRVKGPEAVAFYGSSTAQYVAPRQAETNIPGHLYRTTIWLRRHVTPADPLGDAVEIGIRYLNSAKAFVSQAIITTLPLTSGSGAIELTVTLSTDAGLTPDYVIPAGVAYWRPFVKMFGVDHQTDIISIRSDDETFTGAVDIEGDPVFGTQLAAVSNGSIIKKSAGALANAVADVDYLGLTHITRLAAGVFWTTSASGVSAGFEIRTDANMRFRLRKSEPETGIGNAGSDIVFEVGLDDLSVVEVGTLDRATQTINWTARHSTDGDNNLHAGDFATAAQIRAGLVGKVVTADGALDAYASVALTYAASFTPDLETFTNGSMSLAVGQNITINNPVEAINKRWTILITCSDAGAHTLAFGANYRFDVPITSRVLHTGTAGALTLVVGDPLPGGLYFVRLYPLFA
jgi:hypothetical protein